MLLSSGKASVTAIRVISGTPASTLGAAVQFSAAVSGKSSAAIPTGTVTFKAGKTTLGTATLNSQGVAKISLSDIPFGKSVVTAVYSGSGKFAVSQSASVKYSVTAGATSIKLSTPASSTIGDTASLVARVASAAGEVPTGKVGFYDGDTLLGTARLNSIGAAKMTTTTLYVGSHSIKAVYFGSDRLLGHRSTAQTTDSIFPTLTTSSDGLKTGTVTEGSGTGAVAGDILRINYTSWVASTGKVLQSTSDSGEPFQFQLGAGAVIAGLDEGLVGVKSGETRVLIIPSTLGYGNSAPSLVAPKSTLVFVIQVLSTI